MHGSIKNAKTLTCCMIDAEIYLKSASFQQQFNAELLSLDTTKEKSISPTSCGWSKTAAWTWNRRVNGNFRNGKVHGHKAMIYWTRPYLLHIIRIWKLSQSANYLIISLWLISIILSRNIKRDLSWMPIKLEETLASLKRMKTNKAAGTDGIPVEFYKHCGGIVSQPLTALFNHVMNTSSYRGAWCEGVINPLHKRESPSVPENYRKITITPVIGKIFNGILNNRLQFAKECLGTGDPLQNGFKPGASAIDNIFILNGIIDKCNANGRPLYICFVDFRSAFDLINRSALLFKLLNKGYTGKFLSSIHKYNQSLITVAKCVITANLIVWSHYI